MKIPAKFVQELRNKTGAGMMDCKKALQSSDGNMELAMEALRKKGLALAEKKANRIAVEGIIESYIHAGSRIGVLVEINCETDFVARRSEFQNLAKDLAMQIVACPSVKYVSLDNIDYSIIEFETRIESEKEDLLNKPADIKKKIVSGRIEKRLKEMSLMNQPFIKNTDISIEELIKQHIALLGENIKVRRFEKFLLGEGLEKKEDDFLADVENIINK
uniref:translation elongation factor Ts n=1 Tax=Hypnea cornuta TaxID=105603 RepID=UPI0027DA1120|nr:translation elongation factor Ts [Hypnea cornuta]YP_010903468.1 translation elongation factor Ts [Hypnea cryptica]WCH55723.1 translation elongation factor Ts [Hypnea cornuta]WCH55921.1 translation elongation factor Ts [Hypnea cryptica]